MKFYRYFIIVYLLIFSSLNAAILYHPELKWHTVETEHFYIHYYEGEEEIFKIIANYAEIAYANLTVKYRWIPSDRTHIVVSETEDFANGMATVFPYNTIYLYLIPPEVNSVIGFYDNWLYLLIVHEYTHIIQLDQARGMAGYLRYIFGRSPFTLLPPFTTFPNALMPEWLIEGLATYEESDQTSAGRVKSTLMQTMIESAVRENKLPTIGTGSGDVIEWPWHSFPYFYGGRFYKFLAENFGEEYISSFHEKYSAQPLPLMLNFTSSHTTGYTLTLLWYKWLQKEREKYEGNGSIKTIQIKKLTESGYFTRGIRCSNNGRFLVYTKINPSEYPSVYLYDIEKRTEKRLFFRNYGIDFSWSNDSTGFFFTQAETYSSFYTYNDLYYFSIKEQRLRKITKGMRITEFDLSQDGRTGTGIIIRNAGRILALIDIVDGNIIELTDGQWNKGAYNPRFSPDGSKIVYTEWSVDGFYRIKYFDLFSKETKEIPIPIAFNVFPQWGRDGYGIFFSSDMEGRQNLYYYSLSDNKLYRLKRPGIGIYEFDISPDGKKLYFTGYSSEGFDIYEVDFDENSFELVDTGKITGKKITQKELKEVEIQNITKYSGIKYIYPRFWMPVVLYDSTDGWYFTAMTYNTDPVETHSYTLNAEYYAKYNLAGVNFEYQNDILRPSIGFRYSYSPLRFSDIKTGTSYWMRKNEGELFMHLLFKKFRYRFETGAHYLIKKYNTIDFPEKINYYSAGAGLTLLFDSSKKYSLTPGKQDGEVIAIGFRRYMKELGGDIEFYKAMIDFREYLTFTDNYVFSFYLASGLIWGGLPDELFSIGGFSPRMENAIFGLEESQLYLRGYPSGVDYGTRTLVSSIEFRFPIATLDAGLSTLPIFFQKVHGSIFYDYGDAWSKQLALQDFRDSAGIEIKFDSTIFYGYNITLAIAGAYGFKEDGLLQYSVTLGSSF